MRLADKERKKTTFEIIGEHVEKYRISMIIVSVVVSLIALFFCIYWNFDEAYRNVSFEQEAYDYQHSEEYLGKRKHFAWVKYLRERNEMNY